MTVRTHAVQICDRCQKPFQEKTLKAGDEVPLIRQLGITITQVTGTNRDAEKHPKFLLVFEDLCPLCQGAVEGLISRIRLDGSAPKKEGKKKGRSEKAEDPPKVPEYEDPAPEAPEAPAVAQVDVPAVVDRPVDQIDVVLEPPVPLEPLESSETAPEVLPEGSVRDEKTGDVYDEKTGEVLSRGFPF
jgi:hypothetical protein